MSARLPATCLSLALLAASRPAAQLPAEEVLREVRIEQRLEAQVPLDLELADESGRPVAMGDLLDGKPTVLALVYYRCPRLCTLVLNGLVRALKDVAFDAGDEFRVLTVSIDPTETRELAAEKKSAYLEAYGRNTPPDGWRFLTGTKESIATLAATVGFRYRYDPATKQFAHASGIMLLTPKGRVARYFYGIEYEPRDLRLGIVEAAEERIGSPADVLLLMLCFHYDPVTGKYGFVIMPLIRISGVLTVVALAWFVLRTLRSERARRPGPASLAAEPAREGGS
jgi:protein SCO1/2